MNLSNLSGKNVLIISPESYQHIPVSKHHYSHVLAEVGNNVFFLNPPGQQNKITRDRSRKTLSIIDYKTVRGINLLPGFLRNHFNRRLIKRISNICGARFDIVWTFDPFRFQNLRLFKDAVFRIYHAADIHQSPLEFETASTADVIFAPSQEILKRFSRWGTPTFKINHGLAPHFLTFQPEISKAHTLKVGYVGNMDSRSIDAEVLINIVGNHPDIDFDFIGPYSEDGYIRTRLKNVKNCHFTGRVPSEILPKYLMQCDLFLMCYKDDVAANSNSHKLLEYLASGKPAVINYTDEYRDSDLVIMANNNAELPMLFQKVVKNIDSYSNPKIMARRMSFARANSYWHHIQVIDRILSNFRNAVTPPDSQ